MTSASLPVRHRKVLAGLIPGAGVCIIGDPRKAAARLPAAWRIARRDG